MWLAIINPFECDKSFSMDWIPHISPYNTPELFTHCAFSSRVEFLTWLRGPHLNHLSYKHRPLGILLPRSTFPNSSALSQLPLLNDHFPTWSQVYQSPIRLLALKLKHISSSSPSIIQKLSLFGLRKLTVGISANRESQKMFMIVLFITAHLKTSWESVSPR